MKTNKEIIDSIFSDALYFAEITPVSEFEKYNEYAKTFAKSFNRLIKEIDDPEEQKEIIDWCIKNDEPLTIEIIVSEPSIYNENNLRRNYEVLKNLFLNEIEIPKEKEYDNFKTLKELFVYPETYDKCIDILKKVDPPILNTENKFIGKEKGAFVVWVDVLKKNNLIKQLSNDNLYAQLISNTFQPFSISSEMFRKPTVRANERYETDFNNLLSQVYQSVKMLK